MTPPRTAHRSSASRRPLAGLAGLNSIVAGMVAAALITTGCSSGPDSTADSAPAASTFSDSTSDVNDARDTSIPDARRAEMDARTEAAAQQLDEMYVIGPGAAGELGYRVDWQRETRPSEGSGIRRVKLQHDSVFVLDGKNFLARIRIDDGTSLWRLPIVEPTREVLGINFVPYLNTVYVTGGGGVLVLDGDNGSTVGLQRLDKIAATTPTQVDEFLVYGARSGELVWHSFEQDFTANSYKVARSINIDPIIDSPFVVAVGNNGRVMTLNVESRTQLWSKRMLDTIVARPAIANGVVYIAGRDQYISGIDLRSGQTMWNYLTTSPLETSPIAIDDRVYQWVPGQGLVCFEARPRDAFGGRVIWIADGVSGEVITQHRDRLLVWDQARHTMTTVDAARGQVVSEVVLPSVNTLLSTSVDSGEMYVTAEDGRLLRLVPRD